TVIVNQDRSGNTADISQQVVADLCGERLFQGDVADGQATAVLEHAGDLAEDRRLVRRQVDNTIADDAVGGSIGERQPVNRRLMKLDVGVRRAAGAVLRVTAGAFERLRGPVYADGGAGRSDLLGGEG